MGFRHSAGLHARVILEGAACRLRELEDVRRARVRERARVCGGAPVGAGALPWVRGARPCCAGGTPVLCGRRPCCLVEACGLPQGARVAKGRGPGAPGADLGGWWGLGCPGSPGGFITSTYLSCVGPCPAVSGRVRPAAVNRSWLTLQQTQHTARHGK